MTHRLKHALTTGVLTLIGCIAAQAADSDGAPKVGSLGQLSNMRFEGEKFYSEQELRRVLRFQLEFVLAADPDQPLPAMLQVVQRALRAGYQCSGFADAKVSAALNSTSNQVIVRITEGPRLYCGSLRVEGLSGIATNELLVNLERQLGLGEGAPQPQTASTTTTAVSELAPGPKPQASLLWSPGYPASLDVVSWARAEAAVTNAFGNVGHPMAQFTVDFPRRAPETLPPEALRETNKLSREELEYLQARADGRVVDMLVKVDREGPSCTVVGIEARGSRKNTSADVAGFLGFRPGEPFTDTWRRKQLDALWESGRFTGVTGDQEGGHTDGRVTAILHLEDLPEAPPLSEPLPAEAKTLLAMRRWVQDWTNRTEDMVWRVVEHGTNGTALELIGSPTGNLALRVLERRETATNVLFQALVRQGLAGLHFAKAGTKFANTNFSTALTLGFDQQVSPDANESGHRANLTFFFGFQSSHKDKPPLTISLNSTPAMSVYLAGKPDFTWRPEGNVLVGTISNSVLKVETTTGRLISLTGTEGPKALTNWWGHLEWSFGFEQGTFALAEAEWSRTTEKLTNVCDPAHPLGSGLAYLAAGVSGMNTLARLFPSYLPPENIAAARGALAKLLTPDFFACFERILPDLQLAEEDHMASATLSESASAGSLQAFQCLIALVLAKVPEVVPTNSWLEVALKLPLLGIAGHGDHVDPQFNRLLADQRLGPLASLALGREVGNPKAARHLGITGLLHADSGSFLEDAGPFMNERVVVGQMTASLTRSLGGLEKPELEALASLLDESQASILREAARSVRQGESSSVAELLTPALRKWWDASLKEALKAELRKLTRGRE